MFNYANSIEIVLEQSDNMLRLMNIYQQERKKLIALHDRVYEETMCGTRMYGGDWTEAGLGDWWWRRVGSRGFFFFKGDSKDGEVCGCVSDSTVDNLQLDFFIFQVVYFQKGPLSFLCL